MMILCGQGPILGLSATLTHPAREAVSPNFDDVFGLRDCDSRGFLLRPAISEGAEAKAAGD